MEDPPISKGGGGCVRALDMSNQKSSKDTDHENFAPCGQYTKSAGNLTREGLPQTSYSKIRSGKKEQ